MTREIILDTETTGLSPTDGHRIIEIGAVEMIDKIRTGNEINFYINPERDIPIQSYRIHGISADFLSDKPKFAEIVDQFLDFIEGGVLVIHNAPFDVNFLNYELSMLKRPSIDIKKAVDTLVLAKKAFPGSRVNLDALCKRFKIDNSIRVNHGALTDARLLSEVYIELTGGRQKSFLIQSASKNNISQNFEYKSCGNKIVIYATQEEIEHHKNFIKKIYQ